MLKRNSVNVHSNIQAFFHSSHYKFDKSENTLAV